MMFSTRYQWQKEFEEYAKEQNIKNCVMNFLVFLEDKGYKLEKRD